MPAPDTQQPESGQTYVECALLIATLAVVAEICRGFNVTTMLLALCDDVEAALAAPAALASPPGEPRALNEPRKHQALGRCWCGDAHPIAEAVALNEADA